MRNTLAGNHTVVILSCISLLLVSCEGYKRVRAIVLQYITQKVDFYMYSSGPLEVEFTVMALRPLCFKSSSIVQKNLCVLRFRSAVCLTNYNGNTIYNQKKEELLHVECQHRNRAGIVMSLLPRVYKVFVILH